jgi:hypothetical protein
LTNRFYKDFKKKFPKYKNYTDKQLGEIIFDYNGRLWNAAIEYRDGVELPEGIGNIFIGSCNSPTRKYNSDFGSSIKNNVLTRIKNYETNGFLAKIFYTNYATKYLFAFREFWEFKGTRDFTRTVSATYQENWKKYIKVENNMLISKLYKKANRKIFAMDNALSIADDYNEFNLD